MWTATPGCVSIVMFGFSSRVPASKPRHSSRWTVVEHSEECDQCSQCKPYSSISGSVWCMSARYSVSMSVTCQCHVVMFVCDQSQVAQDQLISGQCQLQCTPVSMIQYQVISDTQLPADLGWQSCFSLMCDVVQTVIIWFKKYCVSPLLEMINLNQESGFGRFNCAATSTLQQDWNFVLIARGRVD